MRKRIEGLIRRKIAFFDGPLEHGALVVCNHSGGVLTPDVLVFAPAFYDESCASSGTWIRWSGSRSRGFQYVWYVRPFASCRAAT